MRLYESVFIARQDVSTTQVENLTKEFSAIIENGGGKIHKNEYELLVFKKPPEAMTDTSPVGILKQYAGTK